MKNYNLMYITVSTKYTGAIVTNVKPPPVPLKITFEPLKIWFFWSVTMSKCCLLTRTSTVKITEKKSTLFLDIIHPRKTEEIRIKCFRCYQIVLKYVSRL